MTSLQSAGYVVSDINGEVIYGMGETVDEAMVEVRDVCLPIIGFDGEEIPEEEALEKHFKVWPATAALMDAVRDSGGAIAWGHVGRVACTVEEEEAA